MVVLRLSGWCETGEEGEVEELDVWGRKNVAGEEGGGVLYPLSQMDFALLRSWLLIVLRQRVATAIFTLYFC
jgi:hypothetical protein